VSIVTSLDPAQLREAVARGLALMSLGHDDEEAAELMQLSPGDWAELKEQVIESEGVRLRGRTDEEVYVEYVTRQTGIVNDLVTVQNRIMNDKDGGPYQVAVGCLKARSEIYDKILKTGQQLGFIRKEPDRKEIGAVVAVLNMSDPELRAEIADSLSGLNELMTRFGGGGDILDVDCGPTHRALPSDGLMPELERRLAAGGGEKLVKPAKRGAGMKHRRHGGRAVSRKKV